MEIKREWAMPNSRTFAIKPIRELIDKYISDKQLVIDPFANNNRIANITNDIDPDCDADYHLDAIDFLKVFEDIGRIVKHGGVVITCGWNSGGIGKKYGFEIVEILMVAHGGWHNDTIVTVEVKCG